MTVLVDAVRAPARRVLRWTLVRLGCNPFYPSLEERLVERATAVSR